MIEAGVDITPYYAQDNSAEFRLGEKSILFGGGNEYAAIGDITQAVGSWVFWIQSTDSSGYVISKVRAGGAFNGEMRIIIEATLMRFRIQNSTGGNFNVFSDAAVNDGNWKHFVCTFPEMKMYVDSVLQEDEVTATHGMEVTGVSLDFGRNNALNSVFYTGNLYEPLLYDTELTQTEVDEIYNNGRKAMYPSLSTGGNIVSMWRATDSTFPTYLDVINGNNAAMTAMEAADLTLDTPP